MANNIGTVNASDTVFFFQMSAAKQVKSTGFESIMNKSNVEQKAATKETNGTSETKSSNEVNTDNSDDNCFTPVNKTNITENKPVGDEKTTDISEDEVILSKAAEAVVQLVAELQNLLGVSSEEIGTALEDLNLTETDLLDPAMLQKTVMKLLDVDESAELLVNEDMSVKMTEAVSTLNNVLEESGLTQEDVNKVKMILDKKTTEKSFDDRLLSQTKADENGNGIIPEKNIQKPNGDDNSDYMDNKADKKPEFEVVKTKTEGSDIEKKDSATDLKSKTDYEDSYQQFINNLASSKTEIVKDSELGIQTIKQVVEITDQIVEKIKVVINDNQTSLEMQLMPESLGKVGLSIVSKDGVMTASFTTQNQISKEAIESQISVLQTTLEEQGIKVESIEVAVSDFRFEQQSQGNGQEREENNRNSRQAHLVTNDITESYSDDSELLLSVMEMNGGNIDVSA